MADAAAFGVPHARLGEDVAAAVVLRAGFQATATELRAYLRDQLAEFKIPRRIAFVDRLPKGATGKTLRRELGDSILAATAPAPESVDSSDGGKLCRELLQIWRRLLNSPTLTIDGDFFESGGDSLLAVNMLMEIEHLMGRPLPSSLLFETPTIRQLARRLSAIEGTVRRRS